MKRTGNSKRILTNKRNQLDVVSPHLPTALATVQDGCSSPRDGADRDPGRRARISELPFLAIWQVGVASLPLAGCGRVADVTEVSGAFRGIRE